MEQIEQLQKIIDEGKSIVFLAERVSQQKVGFLIFAAVMVFICRSTAIRLNKW